MRHYRRFTQNKKKKDLNVYFNRFYNFTVTYFDGERVTYSKPSYFALRRYISEYIKKEIADITQSTEATYYIDYRSTSKFAFEHLATLYNNEREFLSLAHDFDPTKSDIFPYYKIK